MLDKKDELKVQNEVCQKFGKKIYVLKKLLLQSRMVVMATTYVTLVTIFFIDLTAVRERNVEDLSGGELQRFACAVVCIQRADM